MVTVRNRGLGVFKSLVSISARENDVMVMVVGHFHDGGFCPCQKKVIKLQVTTAIRKKRTECWQIHDGYLSNSHFRSTRTLTSSMRRLLAKWRRFGRSAFRYGLIFWSGFLHWNQQKHRQLLYFKLISNYSFLSVNLLINGYILCHPVPYPNALNMAAWVVALRFYIWRCSYTYSVICRGARVVRQGSPSREEVGWLDGLNRTLLLDTGINVALFWTYVT